MKNLLLFFLGIIFVFLISATTQKLMEVKPTLPKSTIVKHFRDVSSVSFDIEKYVKHQVKKGYIVKSISMTNTDSYSYGIIVMEKY